MDLRQATRALLVVNLAIVFLPVLLAQLAVPTLMRGRTSPIPGGALLGAMVVLLLIVGSFRVAAARARRAIAGAGTRTRGEALALVAAALVVVLLGQSLLAGLAEAMGVVRPSAPGAGAAFVLDYPRYALITTLAYVWTVSVLTVLTVSLASGSAAIRVAAVGIRWPGRARLAAVGVASAAMVVFALKVMQHLGR
jgi:hypothetical protein